MKDASPATRQALYLGVCAAAILFCLLFAAPAVVPLRVFWYYPLEHRWALELKPTGLAMDWFGRTGLALAVSIPVGAAVTWLGRRLRSLSPSALALAMGWMATVAVLAMSLYAYQLAVRVPTPEPLPSWYVPR